MNARGNSAPRLDSSISSVARPNQPPAPVTTTSSPDSTSRVRAVDEKSNRFICREAPVNVTQSDQLSLDSSSPLEAFGGYRRAVITTLALGMRRSPSISSIDTSPNLPFRRLWYSSG